MRILEHPILGTDDREDLVTIFIDGKAYKAKQGEVIAAVMLANGLRGHRHTSKLSEPRGIYCGIGQCTDCVMIVDGVTNVRTCVTPVAEGMVIESQYGFGAKER